MILKTSGLPIKINPATHRLSFEDGLVCESNGSKNAGEMKELLCSNENIPENEHCYDFYRNIRFLSDEDLFSRYDFRYDITVIMPGTVNGEKKKTSGHYHGYIGGTNKGYTYPEVYEVIQGAAAYILQRVTDFENLDARLLDVKVAFVEAGQSIIIPPFYGHCSINVGKGPLVFSNIAVVSCPLHYSPIKAKRGLSVWIKEGKTPNGVFIEKNPNYTGVPDFQIVHPNDNKNLGIEFGVPVYKSFIENPEKFKFLLEPSKYMNDFMEML